MNPQTKARQEHGSRSYNCHARHWRVALATLARHPLAHVDLYARLTLSALPPPSQADIRTAYRQLILRHHPDRLHARADEQGAAQARELNQAWEVLRDEAAREAYDQARKEYLTASRATSNACAVSLSLDLFDPHYSPPSTTSQSALVVTADAGEPVYYSHPCRCSSHFLITREQLEEGVEVVGCEGCSERCRVEYEVVEE